MVSADMLMWPITWANIFVNVAPFDANEDQELELTVMF